jgi:hypothetical protein
MISESPDIRVLPETWLFEAERMLVWLPRVAGCTWEAGHPDYLPMRILTILAVVLNAVLLTLFMTLGFLVQWLGQRITWLFSVLVFVVPIVSIVALACHMARRPMSPPPSH